MKHQFSRRSTIVFLIIISILFTILKLRIDCARWASLKVASRDFLPMASFAIVAAHTFITCFLLFLSGTKSRIFAYCIIPASLLVWCVNAYAFLIIGPFQYSEFVFATLGTNWEEIAGFINPTSIICALLAFAAIFIIGFLLQKRFWKFPGWSSCKIITTTLSYIVISSCIVPLCTSFYPNPIYSILYASKDGTYLDGAFAQNDMTSEASPQYCYRTLIPMYRQFAPFVHAWQYFFPDPLIPSETLPYDEKFSDDVSIVLFIGESYTSSHASWNGYNKETLPKLSVLRDKIINFPFFKSYSTGTNSCVAGILSDATCSDRKAKHTSFLGLFNKVGFQNKVVFGRTTDIMNNPSIYHIADGKYEKSKMCQSTEELVAVVSEFTGRPGRKMLVIDEGTGHMPYKHEKQFHQFTADSQDFTSVRKANYDCALLQADDMLARVIAALQNQNAVLLYCSDHGQSFGEGGNSMHAGPLHVVPQRHIFAFIWLSDKYRAKHPEIAQHLEANKNKLLSQDDIYLSILSLGGIEVKEELPGCGNFTKEMEKPDVSSFSLNE